MRRIALSASVALLMISAAVPAAQADGETGGVSVTAAAEAPASAPAPPVVVSPTKAVPLTRTQTKQVQRKVKVRADGALGSRTRTALKRYQKQKTLTPTGRPNLETLKTMRLSFATKIEQKLLLTAPLPTVATPAALATAIDAIRAQSGTPYRNAGMAPGGFDCSGLMVWGFKQAGVDLPRTSFEQFAEGTSVERSAIQPGDLVFFSSAGPGASHVGVATSATTVISATTSGVKEHRIDDSYWGAVYLGARRLNAA